MYISSFLLASNEIKHNIIDIRFYCFIVFGHIVHGFPYGLYKESVIKNLVNLPCSLSRIVA